ncbi:copper chaperone PCu(A)C [Psychrosphaera sp.]|nr:copper chaperone PCu(A)C [Psychrosphaera sp.]
MKVLGLLLSVMMFSGTAFADLSISASDATVRAPIPGMKNTVGYFQLTNMGAKDVVLVSAKSNASEVLEFHNHDMSGGVMRMYQEMEVNIPAGDTIVFESGGLHLMFIAVEPELKSAKLVDVMFTTKSGESFTVPFKVQKLEVKHHH